MKRTIKRTEITIETVEITTIRRTQQDGAGDEAFGHEILQPPPAFSEINGPIEISRENGFEEKRGND